MNLSANIRKWQAKGLTNLQNRLTFVNPSVDFRVTRPPFAGGDTCDSLKGTEECGLCGEA